MYNVKTKMVKIDETDKNIFVILGRDSRASDFKGSSREVDIVNFKIRVEPYSKARETKDHTRLHSEIEPNSFQFKN